jgi:hypothetical protein
VVYFFNGKSLIGGKMELSLAPQSQKFMDLRNHVDGLRTCQGVCMETAAHCLRMGGQYAEAPLVRLLWDCAYVCEMSGEFDRLESPLQVRGAYEIVAELCDRAAQRCASFPYDRRMMLCADTCRRSAEICREKASMMV